MSVLLTACASGAQPESTDADPAPAPTVTAAGSGSGGDSTSRAAAASSDSVSERRARAVARMLERIAGREGEPAGEVFENVELLGSIPAGRFLRVMDVGFGRSLGVGCDHCHVRGDWASDDERPKRVAREMWRMVGRLNGELLPAIEEIEGRATVNCTTCHRGQVVPATDMP